MEITIKTTTNSSKGISFVAGTITGLVAASIVVGVMVYRTPSAKNVIQLTPNEKSEKNYVFVSLDGKHVILSEFDVYNIRQLHKDGVLPSVIAKKYQISTIMVCKIIESTTNLKQ